MSSSIPANPASQTFANELNKINYEEFSILSRKLHDFFHSENFLEAFYQHHLDVLTACEDPENVGLFHYFDTLFPLRQTNQMGLEEILLNDPKRRNYYCFSTSYRFEKNPVVGRHNTIFPMVEFETNDGTLESLIVFATKLIKALGYKGNFCEIDYEEACDMCKTMELNHDDEDYLCKTLAPVVFLKNFPERTHPFFNMERDPENPGYARKLDVLMLGRNSIGETKGMETIGSAVRSCDVAEMKRSFLAISNGEYAALLYKKFGKERVDNELNRFLSLPMFPRAGGGIGFSRLLNFVRYHGLL